jgi:hypothetical protein
MYNCCFNRRVQQGKTWATLLGVDVAPRRGLSSAAPDGRIELGVLLGTVW